MRQRIRLTERDIRKVIMRCINEARSNGEAEFVDGIYNVYEIVEHWADAARNGFSEYNGKKYTADDWKATLFNSNFRKWAIYGSRDHTGGESIKAAVGKEIKSKSQTKADKKAIKKARAEGKPIPPEIADKPNKYVKPDSSFYEDVYSSFFYASGLNTKSETGMEAGEHLENMGFDAMAPTWLKPKKDGRPKTAKEIVNQMTTALQTYAIHYYRFNTSDMISNASGNLNLTATDNDKDKEQTTGTDLSTTYNTNIGDYDPNLDDEQIDSTFDMPDYDTNSRMEAREQIKELLGFLLDECNSDIAQFHTQDTIDKKGVVHPKTMPYLIYTIKYMLRNFDKLFDEETLDQIIPEDMKAPTKVAKAIRELTAEFVTKSYNDAIRKKYEDPTYTDDVLNMFPVRDLNDKGKEASVKVNLNDPNVAITPKQFELCLREDMDKLYAYVYKTLDNMWKTIGVNYVEVKDGEDVTADRRNRPHLERDRKNPGQKKLMKPSPFSHGGDLRARKERKDQGKFPLDLSVPYDRKQYIELYKKYGPQYFKDKYGMVYVPKPEDLANRQISSLDKAVNEAIRRIKMLAR